MVIFLADTRKIGYLVTLHIFVDHWRHAIVYEVSVYYFSHWINLFLDLFLFSSNIYLICTIGNYTTITMHYTGGGLFIKHLNKLN